VKACNFHKVKICGASLVHNRGGGPVGKLLPHAFSQGVPGFFAPLLFDFCPAGLSCQTRPGHAAIASSLRADKRFQKVSAIASSLRADKRFQKVFFAPLASLAKPANEDRQASCLAPAGHLGPGIKTRRRMARPWKMPPQTQKCQLQCKKVKPQSNW
jgi:hypothetical protein